MATFHLNGSNQKDYQDLVHSHMAVQYCIWMGWVHPPTRVPGSVLQVSHVGADQLMSSRGRSGNVNGLKINPL